MNLERLLMEQKVKIVGVHSVVLVEDSIVDIIYDVVADECGMGLNFRLLYRVVLVAAISRNSRYGSLPIMFQQSIEVARAMPPETLSTRCGQGIPPGGDI